MAAQAQLVIHFVDGKVSVTGPIQDKGFCYMLLECARDAIKDYTDKRGASTGLVVPKITLPQNLGNGEKGV